MTPFQQFRLWARRAPAGERTAAAAVGLVVCAVVAWLLVPGSGPGGSQAGTTVASGAAHGQVLSGAAGASGPASDGGAGGGAQPGGPSGPTAAGPAPAGGAGGAGPAPSSGTGGGTGPGPTATQGSGSGGGCSSPPGTDQGVTPGQIRIAVTITDIAGPAANSTFGLPSAQEQQEDYQQVVDSINASGGVACRKLVPVYFTGNPADQAGLQQICLETVQAGVFAEFDSNAYYATPALANCFPQHQLPFFGTAYFPKDQQAQQYPYLFGQGLLDILYHNFVMASKQLGYFGPSDGFKKLGFLYEDCEPGIITEFEGWLNQVGVSAAQIVTYNLGCPTGVPPASELEQAVLKFQGAGVTHVTEAQAEGNLPVFTDIAQQQGFHPKYRMAQDGLIYIAYGAQRPDPNQMADAVVITSDRLGEERTPGMSPTPGTTRCNAIFSAHGRPPVGQQPLGFGGQVCDELWMFAASLDHAPALKRSALGAGLHTAGSVDFSYPWGPSSFAAPQVTYGGQYWRVDRFFTSCQCWRVTDRTFHPSFSGF